MKKNEIGGVRLRKEYIKPALRVVKLQGKACLLQVVSGQMSVYDNSTPWPVAPGTGTLLQPW